MDIIQNEYKFNGKFRKFVDEYCKEHKCEKQDAFNQKLIKQEFWRYTEV